MIYKILKNYNRYKENNFSKIELTYKQYISFLNDEKLSIFERETVGKSFLDKEIFLFRAGSGEKKVLLWSQMHGNEPISSQGLIDFMLFMNAKDEFDELRNTILNNVTIYCLPLLNPDGSELATRRNAQEIDLNRDALKLVSPEARLLDRLVDEIKPDFAFNLHDQERYYGTANSQFPTTIAFLSPAFNAIKTVDIFRERAMQVIGSVNSMLQEYLHGRTAKYNDAYMPNAFGDNVQRKKISTILFEAGYAIGDKNRQEVRKYYFLAIVYAVKIIAEDSYRELSTKIYKQIPTNIKQKFCDFVYKNVVVEINNKSFVTDISVIRNVNNSDYFSDSTDEYIIKDIGDMNYQAAFLTVNCNGNKVLKSIKKQQKINIQDGIIISDAR